MQVILLGALGGAAVAIAALFTQDEFPLRTYMKFSDETIGTTAFIGWLVRLALLSIAGAVWVKLNDERVPLKAFQLGTVAPAAIAGMLGLAEAKDVNDITPTRATDSTNVKRFDAFIVGLLGKKLEFTDSISDVNWATVTGTKPASDTIGPLSSDLATRFYSGERKKLSDSLASLYKSSSDKNLKAALVDSLIGALQPSGSSNAYRVNVYIARTLALTGGWDGNKEQQDTVKSLTKSGEYKDSTFRYWVDAALKSARQPEQ